VCTEVTALKGTGAEVQHFADHIIVGNAATEFLFEIHCHFNPIEAVGVEIVIF
jgi:hypothetical protein